MILELHNLSIRYGRKVAIDRMSLSLEGGAVGLLGPNGAGKSTLIKAVLGFLRPAAGGGQLLGHDIAQEPLVVRSKVGYMPESQGQIPGMNGVGFVTFCGELAGMGRVDAMGRAHEVLSYVGLGEARYRSVDTYSTGMKQRIKLAQALIHDPKVLFLDEPTNGMDPSGRREMLDLVRDISTRKKITTILCSHLLPDVEYACRDVVVLNRGQVVTQGNIEDLKSRRRSVYLVRGKGDEGAFVVSLEKAGCQVSRDQDKMLRVNLPVGGHVRILFEAARRTDFQVRHLSQFRMTLEEVFLDAIGAKRDGAVAQVAGLAAEGG